MADHKEYWSTESDQGSIRISEDVVASIAALAASETDGVSGLYSSVTRDIVSFLSKKNLSKGVRVELGEGDTVKVEISFLALFGHNICEVAKQDTSEPLMHNTQQVYAGMTYGKEQLNENFQESDTSRGFFA